MRSARVPHLGVIFAATTWALHPMRVEVLGWLSCQSYLLATILCLASLQLRLEAGIRSGRYVRRYVKRYGHVASNTDGSDELRETRQPSATLLRLGASICFLLACMSKACALICSASALRAAASSCFSLDNSLTVS